MKKTLFLLPILFTVFIACNNDKGNDDNPINKKKLSRDKDENKDEFPNNRDYGMDRDYEDGDNSKSSITGRWRIVSMGDDSQEYTIEFKRDGSYLAITTHDDGDTEKNYGTYKYNSRDKTLETVDGEGLRETSEVEFRGKNKIIIMYESGNIALERD